MISTFKRIIAAGALLAILVPAQADPAMECSVGDGSQVETHKCISRTAEIADATMEAALGFAMSSATELDNDTGRKVATTARTVGQAEWSKYRDKHCSYVGATFGGGSGTGSAILACRVELARSRSNELMKIAQ